MWVLFSCNLFIHIDLISLKISLKFMYCHASAISIRKKKTNKQNGFPEPIQHYQTTVTYKQTKWLPGANTIYQTTSKQQ